MDNTPTYQVAADNSEVKGTITFFARDNGYYGQIILTNFPEGYVITSTLVTTGDNCWDCSSVDANKSSVNCS